MIESRDWVLFLVISKMELVAVVAQSIPLRRYPYCFNRILILPAQCNTGSCSTISSTAFKLPLRLESLTRTAGQFPDATDGYFVGAHSYAVKQCN